MNVKYLLTLKKSWNQAVIEYENLPEKINEDQIKLMVFNSLLENLIKMEPWSEKSEKNAIQKLKDDKVQ